MLLTASRKQVGCTIRPDYIHNPPWYGEARCKTITEILFENFVRCEPPEDIVTAVIVEIVQFTDWDAN